MTLPRASFLFLCFQLLAPLLYNTSDAALSSYILQDLNCSTSGNYTTSSAYAANVNQFLAALAENAVSKNGGFFNGTVGLGPDTVYGLVMCPADFSRADCGDCLAGAAASSSGGLTNRCPGSTTVLAMFDRCLIRYSNVNFFGTPEKAVVVTISGQTLSTSTPGLYSPKVAQSFKDRTAEAIVSPQRFSASATDPYTFVQCTWDLSADKCEECLNALSANASDVIAIRMDGQRKSYSCTVRYSNTSFMVVPFTPVSGPTPQSVGQTGASAQPPSAKGPKAAIVGGAVVAVLGVISLAALFWYAYKLRGQRNTKEVRRFSYRELAKATSKFAVEERLGAGSFGTVYKGKVKGIRNHQYVAIKMITIPGVTITTTPQQQVRMDPEQVRRSQEQVMIDFDNEIKVMSPLHHRNIISLIGWCKENNSLFLVYELMENGNLDDQLYCTAGAMDSDLHGVTVPGTALLLDWPKRNSILIGMATGLVYLHCECGERLLHRDIKPSNVMLDKIFNAKLCDFGLVTQFSHNSTHHSTDNLRGTRGYVDPAYAESGKACEQNDIYSFGIVLLEVVCCQRPTLTVIGDRMRNNLIDMVRRCHYQGNGILGAADRRLRGPFDEQLRRVLMIGLSCVQPDRHERPHIRTVLGCLTGHVATLPSLPAHNHILPTVNESGPVASISHSSNATEDYSTCSTVLPAQSGTVDDAGSTPLLSAQ